jgi:hypothetical protein
MADILFVAIFGYLVYGKKNGFCQTPVNVRSWAFQQI